MWIWNYRNNSPRKHLNDLSFGTWNIRSLYRTGSCQTVAEEIKKYRMKIVALQEVRWQGTGTTRIGEGNILYGDCGATHNLGTGFYVHNSLMSAIKEFKLKYHSYL
uniref:Craniofacial development protein 2-like n=1 Tax=Cacopsylla melanoneura TaxID=428564 RepID=A0A8D8QQ10_9HEMI